MILNKFSNKAIVLFDGIWQLAFGEQGPDGIFIFLRNGRVELVKEGHWFFIGFECSEKNTTDAIIRENIYTLKNKKKITDAK